MSHKSVHLSRLQALIDEQTPGTILSLPPPGEFFGQIVIDKPITIVGSGKSTWIGARSGPVITIGSKGVVLRNLMVEIVGAPEDVAIEALPDTAPVLEGVTIRGDVVGVTCASTSPADDTVATRITFSPPPPISPSAEENLPDAHIEEGNPKQAPLSRLERKIESLLDQANRAEELEDWDKAIEAYEDILILFPGHAEAAAFLNLALSKQQKRDRLPRYKGPAPTSAPGSADGKPKIIQSSNQEMDRLVERAKQGELWAQIALAFRFEYGLSVPRSMEKAIHWYEQAAKNGSKTSRIKLQALLK